MSIITVAKPREFHLTVENLNRLGVMPYYVGNTWRPRWRVRHKDTQAAVDFTNALIDLIIKDRFEDTDDQALIIKTIANGGVVLDNQVVDPGTPATNSTGRGWFATRFEPSDQATLLDLSLANPLRRYEIRCQFLDGSRQIFYRGLIEINPPLVRNVI